MDLSRYQELSKQTDQQSNRKGDTRGLMISLLGLAGEAGGLLTEFKKRLRDGKGYQVFLSRIEEELGDILWYVSNIATRSGLDLGAIATKNLHKNQERWPLEPEGPHGPSFDSEFPPGEQLPRKFKVELREIPTRTGLPRVAIRIGNQRFGNTLTDNAHFPDGYRFHDAFHFAHIAFLGWSPVVRAALKKQRRSDARVDEVEDGGRAKIIEESIVGFVYNDASGREYYASVKYLDNTLLATIRSLVAGLEVNRRTTGDWQRAILEGYRVFRSLVRYGGGVLHIDTDRRQIRYARLPKGKKPR